MMPKQLTTQQGIKQYEASIIASPVETVATERRSALDHPMRDVMRAREEILDTVVDSTNRQAKLALTREEAEAQLELERINADLEELREAKKEREKLRAEKNRLEVAEREAALHGGGDSDVRQALVAIQHRLDEREQSALVTKLEALEQRIDAVGQTAPAESPSIVAQIQELRHVEQEIRETFGPPAPSDAAYELRREALRHTQDMEREEQRHRHELEDREYALKVRETQDRVDVERRRVESWDHIVDVLRPTIAPLVERIGDELLGERAGSPAPAPAPTPDGAPVEAQAQAQAQAQTMVDPERVMEFPCPNADCQATIVALEGQPVVVCPSCRTPYVGRPEAEIGEPL